VVDQVHGRRIRVGGHWLADFASCNYLGLDLDPEVQAGVPEYLARWGTHPSWARGIAHNDLEHAERLLRGAPPGRRASSAWGVATSNTSGFPLVELALADADDLDAVGRHLFDRGIYVTLAPYPVVPRREVGFRIQLTAANTAEQVDHLLAVLEELDDRFGRRRPHP
jgi:7-keto-8-aminopelargonate synthetase-like enzyme